MKKLKNKSKKIMMAAVAGLSLLFSSCSFFQHAQIKTEITDISKDTGFSEIVTQGYMGGSLVYNDKNVSLGQLAEGVCAGIRLSKAESKEVGNGQTVFKEIDNSAQYGLLQIEKKHLIGRYGLDEVNKIQANLFLGLKNLKVLGISIGDIGKNWDWDLAEYRCTIIPKTKFYDKELN